MRNMTTVGVVHVRQYLFCFPLSLFVDFSSVVQLGANLAQYVFEFTEPLLRDGDGTAITIGYLRNSQESTTVIVSAVKIESLPLDAHFLEFGELIILVLTLSELINQLVEHVADVHDALCGQCDRLTSGSVRGGRTDAQKHSTFVLLQIEINPSLTRSDIVRFQSSIF